MAKKKTAQLADAIEQATPQPMGNRWLDSLSPDAREFVEEIIERRKTGRLTQYSMRKLHAACKQVFVAEFPKDKCCAKSTFDSLFPKGKR